MMELPDPNEQFVILKALNQFSVRMTNANARSPSPEQRSLINRVAAQVNAPKEDNPKSVAEEASHLQQENLVKESEQHKADSNPTSSGFFRR